MKVGVIAIGCLWLTCSSAQCGIVAPDEFMTRCQPSREQQGTRTMLLSDLVGGSHRNASAGGDDVDARLIRRTIAYRDGDQQRRRVTPWSAVDSNVGSSNGPEIWGSGKYISDAHQAGVAGDLADDEDAERFEARRLTPMMLLMLFALIGAVSRWLWGASIRAVIS